MLDRHILSLVSGLYSAPDRKEAARLLARQIGARDLLIFVHDEKTWRLLPAPGFQQTLPGGLQWRDFLKRCQATSPNHGALPFPSSDSTRAVLGLTSTDGAVLVLIDPPAAGTPEYQFALELTLLLPLLAAAFRGERSELFAKSESHVAAQSANQARLLAVSLDKARAGLAKALADAEAANRGKDRFLATLSHELRTPLNPVLLLASEAATDPSLPLEVRADFEMIRKNVELEARLIDDLLDLTSIIHGKVRLEKTSVRPKDVLRDALETVQPEMDAKAIVLSIDLGAADPAANADSVRLQQVYWNVLRNAAKFTPSRGQIEVKARFSAEDSRFTVEVKDSGIGMSPAELKKIFAAFSQGDHAAARGSQRYGGLGLGLLISKTFTEMHGGTIQSSSDGPGLGSTFTISIPAQVENEVAWKGDAPRSLTVS